MTLSDLAALGSFVSGLAVLVSLVFLYFQLRQIGAQIAQAEKNQTAAIFQGRTGRLVDMRLSLLDASAADAYVRGVAGDPGLTATQYCQFNNFFRANFYSSEETFYQHKIGLLSEEVFSQFVNGYTRSLTNLGVRALWVEVRIFHSAGFAAFTDDIIARTKVTPHLDALADWNTRVAALKTAAAP